MKIIKILSAVTFSVLLFSCGGKGTDKEEKNTDKKIEDVIADCNCSELTEADGELKGVTKKGSKDLYTGVCVTKDQYDTITNKNTFKNGWLVNEIVKEKIGNEYIITKDIDYENGEPDTYKYVKTEQNNSAKLTFVKNYKEYKKKKAIIDYNITIFSGEKFSLAVSTHYRDGNEFSHKNASPQPVCMPNSDGTIDGGWRLDGLSQDRLYEILDDLKKEFPHFNYWKN
ncbi:hypothetical protein [Flavobacterium sp.]|uniref:hypothetical protein n=1 Tax=Flavobacterium sp. TaxID=239 RepID=UPI00374CC832